MIKITFEFATVALAAAMMNQLNGAQLGAVTALTDGDATADLASKPRPHNPTAQATVKQKAEKTASAAEPVQTTKIAGTSPTATAEATPTADAAASSFDKAVAAIDYPTLQKAVFALVGQVKAKNLDPAEHVLGIAKSFGFANFAAMKDAGPAGAAKFADALVAVQAKAVELEAA